MEGEVQREVEVMMVMGEEEEEREGKESVRPLLRKMRPRSGRESESSSEQVEIRSEEDDSGLGGRLGAVTEAEVDWKGRGRDGAEEEKATVEKRGFHP